MTPDRLIRLKQVIGRLWVFSPERLWLLSNSLHKRGHWILAFVCKQVNTLLYSNSLGAGATVSPDVFLGHYGMGTVISDNVEIGERVVIWHGVTLGLGRSPRGAYAPELDANGEVVSLKSPERPRIIVEDDVMIGAYAVIVGPRGGTLRLGKGARIGAGVVVSQDIPPGATVVNAPPRVIERTTSAPGVPEQPAEDHPR